MVEEIKNKLSTFIDDLLEYRLDELEINISKKGKKKEVYYSIDIDTKVPALSNNIFGMSFTTQVIRFSVCPQNGSIMLLKDDFKDYFDEDLDFAKKYSNIIEIAYLKRQKDIIDKIVDTSYFDLKLQRESNIKKLVG